ncbi:MAG: gamma-glutamylcyclotransferase [Synechococcales cyanobacterium CRU_2_2]|nr:gamma-glutamylcyclotransferase [Synechococcales cyanobacterium CRU_2_2]
MALTRETLVSEQLQQMVRQAPELLPYLLSTAELQASIAQTLSQKPNQGDVWIFAYGSLIWNPILHYGDRRPSKIYGWHRRFCMRTPIGRGTPEQQGLVLALERGGSCRGVAYRVAAEHVSTELLLLWKREMLVGSYIPRWVKLLTEMTESEPKSETESKPEAMTAIAFTINPRHPLYAPRLSVTEVAATIAIARGSLGSCADYLHATITGLAECGIIDRHLLSVRDRLERF